MLNWAWEKPRNIDKNGMNIKSKVAICKATVSCVSCIILARKAAVEKTTVAKRPFISNKMITMGVKWLQYVRRSPRATRSDVTLDIADGKPYNDKIIANAINGYIC